MPNTKDIKQFVSIWNQICPIDRWWRKKYNIPFNSPAHRALSFIDMYYEYCEYKFYSKLSKQNKQEGDRFENDIYVKGQGNFIKAKVYSQEEIDTAFDNIDLDKIE